MSKCDGACCSAFYVVPEMEDDRRVRDWQYINDMLMPLTLDAAAQRWVALGYDEARFLDQFSEADGTTRLWTCRYWDVETRLCTHYESRPDMCSAYPYGRDCPAGCGYTNAHDEVVKADA